MQKKKKRYKKEKWTIFRLPLFRSFLNNFPAATFSFIFERFSGCHFFVHFWTIFRLPLFRSFLNNFSAVTFSFKTACSKKRSFKCVRFWCTFGRLDEDVIHEHCTTLLFYGSFSNLNKKVLYHVVAEHTVLRYENIYTWYSNYLFLNILWHMID